MTTNKNNRFKVLTPDGYKNFFGISTISKECVKVILENQLFLECSIDHPLIGKNDILIAGKSKIGDSVLTKQGWSKIISINHIGKKTCHDLLNVEGRHLYYTNDIVSHNSFLGSSMTLINENTLSYFKKYIQSSESNVSEEEINGRNVKIFKKSSKGRTYCMGIDTGEGLGGDYSTILIADITEVKKIEIVASFGSNNISTAEFAYLVAKLGARYNYCMISGERNGVGKAVFDTLWNIYNYENLIFYKNPTEPAQEPGIHLTNTLKVDACLWAKTFIELQGSLIDFKLNEKMIVYEMEWFERNDKSSRITFQATKNHHDDYIMALVWLLFLIKNEIAEMFFDIRKSFLTPYHLEIPEIIQDSGSDEFEFESTKQSEKNIDAKYSHITQSNIDGDTSNNSKLQELNDEIYTSGYNDIANTMREMEYNNLEDSWHNI